MHPAKSIAAVPMYRTRFMLPSVPPSVVAGRGWIAVALVIFAGYRPIGAVLASLLFGAITALGFVGQACDQSGRLLAPRQPGSSPRPQ